MTEDEYYAQKNAIFLKSEEEWLKNRIADICEDNGSTDGTPSGIADADDRASCEIEIKRTKRDHARRLRQHLAKLALHRAKVMADRHESRMLERLRSPDQQADSDRGSRFSTALPARQIMERFNRKTGQRR